LATFATTKIRAEILSMLKALARAEAKKMLTRREQALIEDSAAGASEAELRKKADANSQKAESSIKIVREAEGGPVFNSDGSQGNLPPGELLTWQHVDRAEQGLGDKGRKSKQRSKSGEAWALRWTVDQLKNQLRLRNAVSATSSEDLFKLLEKEALHVLHLGNILLKGKRLELVTRMGTILRIEAQIEEVPESCLENEQDEAVAPGDADQNADVDQSSPAIQQFEEVQTAPIANHVEALLPDKKSSADNAGLPPVRADRLIFTPQSQVPADQVEEWMRLAGNLDPTIPTYLKEINPSVVSESVVVASSSSSSVATYTERKFSSARAKREVERADQRVEFLMKAAVEGVAQGHTRQPTRKSRAKNKPVSGTGKYCHEMCAFGRASDGRQMCYCSNGDLCHGGGWYHEACLNPYDLCLAQCKDIWICWSCHLHTTRKRIQTAHPPLEEDPEDEEGDKEDAETDESGQEDEEDEEDEEDKEDEEDEEEEETDDSADEDMERKPKPSKRQVGPPRHGGTRAGRLYADTLKRRRQETVAMELEEQKG
jgi:hypothetical protein